MKFRFPSLSGRAFWGAAGLLVGGTVAALAAGYYTNDLPLVGPTQTYKNMTGYELVPADTQLANGAPPQTVAPSTMQLAALGAAMAANTATAVSGAATLSTEFGSVTTDSLTTAAGATYTLTLTNSTITAASKVQAQVFAKTSTAGLLRVTSVTPAAGSVVIVVTNVGTAAANGTALVTFQTY